MGQPQKTTDRLAMSQGDARRREFAARSRHPCMCQEEAGLPHGDEELEGYACEDVRIESAKQK